MRTTRTRPALPAPGSAPFTVGAVPERSSDIPEVASPSVFPPAAPTARWPRSTAIVAAVAAPALAGAVAGWWTPRGPNDTVQALSAMALGLMVGALAGIALRSRAAIVVPPVVFAVAFELVRLGATGATVDGISLTSEYGIMAFVVGRLFHGLLALLPMAVGAAFAAGWSRRRSSALVQRPSIAGRMARSARLGVLTVATAVLVVLAIALVRPATTDPILGPDGERLPGSIAEFATIDIGGHDQRMLIRGHDVDDPVVLFLAGGPGGSEIGAMSQYAHPLEEDFVVVTWDQLGTGRSTGQFDPSDTLTVDGAVSDAIAVTEYLLDRFGDEQLYVVGNSYGTLLGVRAIEERPDLYAAFIGTGQMVDAVATDKMFYEDALAHAEATGDTALVTTLVANGPPPYDDLLDMAPLVASEHEWNDYTGIDGFPGRREPTDNVFVTEYTLMDQVRSMANLMDTYQAMYPDLYDIDLRETTSVDVPVYMAQGANEARGRAVLADEWFDRLDAPDKARVVFERSGHRPWVQEPQRFAEVMTGTVLARTAPEVVADGEPAGAAPESDELRQLFTDYNPAVWPAQGVAYALALLALWRLRRRPGRGTDRLVSAVLTAAWLWLGVVFFGRHATSLDPLLSTAYGALFVFEAALLARAGFGGRGLRFAARGGVAGRVGWGLLAYALVVYPTIGLLLGHGYPESPLFGVAPCPTTIATFGLLFLVRPPLPRHLLIIPVLWSVLAPLAAVGHGYPEDLGLAAAGLAAVVVALTRARRGRYEPPESAPATIVLRPEELVR